MARIRHPARRRVKIPDFFKDCVTAQELGGVDI